MKALIVLNSIFILLIPFSGEAQNSWNLTIAFEDGTGAKDTLRLYWDETATINDDISFGEVATMPNDSGVFEVFFRSVNVSPNNTEYYKNIAGPWWIEGFDGEIHAFNFVEPVTFSYNSNHFTDSSLFPFIDSIGVRGEMDNDYFFFGPLSEFPCDCLDMEDHDTIVLPADWPHNHFPIDFTIWRTNGDPLSTKQDVHLDFVFVYPNPSQKGYLNLKQSDEVNFESFEILDLNGQIVKKGRLEKSQTRIKTDGISSGTYLLRLFLESGEAISKRLVIN